MRKSIALLLLILFSACFRRTSVEVVNPVFPGRVDTMQVRKVIRTE